MSALAAHILVGVTPGLLSEDLSLIGKRPRPRKLWQLALISRAHTQTTWQFDARAMISLATALSPPASTIAAPTWQTLTAVDTIEALERRTGPRPLDLLEAPEVESQLRVVVGQDLPLVK